MIFESVFGLIAEIFVQAFTQLDTVGGFVRYILYNYFYHAFNKENRKNLKYFYKVKSGKKMDNFDLRFSNSVVGLLFYVLLFYIMSVLIKL